MLSLVIVIKTQYCCPMPTEILKESNIAKQIIRTQTSSSLFFVSGFSFTNIHDSQGIRGKGRPFLTRIFCLHQLHRPYPVIKEKKANSNSSKTAKTTMIARTRSTATKNDKSSLQLQYMCSPKAKMIIALK